jgi:uncharacterized protein (DUF305 family)
MRRATDHLVTIALVLTVGLLAGCDGSGSEGAAAKNPSGSVATSPIPSAQTTLAATSRTTPPPVPVPTGKPAHGKHNAADVLFAGNIVTHHAQGIEMAHILVGKSYIDPAVLSLASRIESDQAPQIERLRSWLTGWHRPVPAPNRSPTGSTGDLLGRVRPSLPGMMSTDDMAALRRLDGVEGAKLFLAMIVNHELGAIQLAGEELIHGRNREAHKLAQTIIDREQVRVRAANELLDGRMHPPGHY